MPAVTKVNLKVTKLPSDSLALTNKVYLNPADAKLLKKETALGNFIQVKDFVFTFEEHDKVEKGLIGFNSVHRRFALLSLNEPVDAILYTPPVETIYLSTLTLEVDFLAKKQGSVEYK